MSKSHRLVTEINHTEEDNTNEHATGQTTNSFRDISFELAHLVLREPDGRSDHLLVIFKPGDAFRCLVEPLENSFLPFPANGLVILSDPDDAS